jgi:hypothetical protein
MIGRPDLAVNGSITRVDRARSKIVRATTSTPLAEQLPTFCGARTSPPTQHMRRPSTGARTPAAGSIGKPM